MKILYGVQGTGNGHITRARAMQVALAAAGIEVDWVFSGRERSRFFDMQAFGDFKVFKGLSFATKAGKVDMIKTFAEASLHQMYQDIRTLDLSQYQLVITDFEPVVAWAARKMGIACLGIGHQYAFDHPIPKAANSFASNALMKWFAPVTLGIGVHWHHFGQAILPPIIEVDRPSASPSLQSLVYLPFEKSDHVLAVLQAAAHEFIFHCGDIAPGQYANVRVRGFSREGFRDSLYQSDGVICNAGFELASEALTLGRKIMVKPLHGQMEQASNALALTGLNLGISTDRIDSAAISRFIDEGQRRQVNYPNVAGLLADWLSQYPHDSLASLVDQCWAGVTLPPSSATAALAPRRIA
ncbi:MAG: glycosyltransferase [Reinekea forsetii]|uniref:MJ1255/VC2487 family glycosyltransferase n=1 Tax=Reinekea sp. TaxID=1970455 RepID=UPI00237269E6|nr:MJ1255/VC2487 family glycosyltransferase [Reinekea sp.]MDB9894824.1 glycosyltransferase [Reinekea forsetii]MDO7673277.1 glycosyltransferase [Reinekea forsetii]